MKHPIDCLGPQPGVARTYNEQSAEGGGDCAMDRMKKILSSPITKKRTLATNRYFGIPLEELIKREGTTVPQIVQKVCAYIYQHGLNHEGLFRISGNTRVVERLRASYDRTGDADLAESGDVMAVAGLLKLFLRELPDSAIPEAATTKFALVQEECMHNSAECVRRLRALLLTLPPANYILLKHLCRFLVVVSLYEEYNKMNAIALGIVFGPNLFTCVHGIEGLRQQGVTNQVVHTFITKYDQLFLDEREISPSENFSLSAHDSPKKSRTAPPRPPPPQVKGESPISSPPTPSPRKTRPRIEISHEGEVSDAQTTPRSTSDGMTPRLSDDEYMDSFRSGSPFVLDSDRSETGSSVVPDSPLLPSGALEMVEKTISSVVALHLFGDGCSVSSDDGLSVDSRDGGPVPAPRRKKKPETNGIGKENRPSSESLSMKTRIQQFENDDLEANGSGEGTKPHRQRPKSMAFEFFEESGIIISSAPNVKSPVQSPNTESTSKSKPTPKPRPNVKAKHHGSNGSLVEENLESVHTSSQDSVQSVPDSEDSGFGSIQRGNPTLSNFKRVAGPKNRRTPTRPSLSRKPGEDGADDLKDICQLDNESSRDDADKSDGGDESPKAVSPLLQKKDFLGIAEDDDEDDDDVVIPDENHNATKPSISFLDIHHNNRSESKDVSPERSPTGGQKPYIPPLDLSILHEHGDGSDPIPAEDGPSLSIHKSRPFKEEDVMLSPRMTKLKKKINFPEVWHDENEEPVSPSAFKIIAYPSSAHHDTNVPPSPPTEQSLFTKSSSRAEEEQATYIKQLTKRIQSCKKKIKTFEETFEAEYGYRPSQSDKASRPEIKKIVQELAKARKELRRVKEENQTMQTLHLELTSQAGSPGSVGSGAGDAEEMPLPPSIESTLAALQKRLADKRQECERPEDMTLMRREQVQDEKLAVQKALLQYENVHGRPTTKHSKDIMKPLYDRYRNIKRILMKPVSPRDKSLDLAPVPEDHPIEFPSPSTSASTTNRETVRVPTASSEDEGMSREFMVTQNLGLLKDTLRPLDSNARQDLSPEGPSPASWKANLHQMTIPQLCDEQQKARVDKKRLRKILREFEDDFLQQTGRKVQKEDRAPMDSEYLEYKQIKARLKLLDALLSKHDPMAII